MAEAPLFWALRYFLLWFFGVVCGIFFQVYFRSAIEPLPCPAAVRSAIEPLPYPAAALAGIAASPCPPCPPPPPPPPPPPQDSRAFCPPPRSIDASAFLEAGRQVDLQGAVACGDAVLYGYDSLYESMRLFEHTTFMGVPHQQPPNDVMAIMEILWKDKPHVVIEMGSYLGGGAMIYASVPELRGGPAEFGRVITIDPQAFISHDPYIEKCAQKRGSFPCGKAPDAPLFQRRVDVITGDPGDSAVVARVRELLEAARKAVAPQELRVAVIEDSFHAYNMVLRNLDAMAQFVTPGQLLLVQDTKLTRIGDFHCNGGMWGEKGACGPLHAVETFLKRNPDFVRDREPESWTLYSQHAMGYLRRKI
jgi:cephalosporin hydroxylase